MPELSDLPGHLTHFVGRQRELEELQSLVCSTRLLTLTGAGGSGKTRLAGELAVKSASRFERVGWVDLTPVTEPAAVVQQLIESLHIPERAESDPRDVVRVDISKSSALIVLDNCEHVIESCAELAEFLLRNCPKLQIVATSREALGVASETSWLVPPLESQEALQLFVDRAQSALSTFRLSDANVGAIREICRRLDGLPLAIELAAARIRVLSPEQIAERLNDAFRLLSAGSRTALPRHRTLRATIDWSHSLLNHREQVLLARLAVFSGTLSLEAVESVCQGDPLADDDLLDGLAALVEKSLVVMAPDEGIARYRLLETVRQYAIERLEAIQEHETRREQHALFFAEYAEQVAPRLIGGEHETGLTVRVRQDNDNIRTALTWALANNARSVALRLVGSLGWFWYCTGQFHDARQFALSALALGESADPVLRGRAIAAHGIVSLARGDYDIAQQSLEVAIPLLERSSAPHDREGAAVARSKLGATLLMKAEYARAERCLAETLERYPECSPIVRAFVTVWKGWSRLAQGAIGEARDAFVEALEIGVVMGHKTTIAHSLAFIGFASAIEGDVETASSELLKCVTMHVELHDVWGLTIDIDALATVAARRGDWVRASALFAANDALREQTGIALMAVARDVRLTMVNQAREALGAAFDRETALWSDRTIDDVVQLALQVAKRENGSAETVAVDPPFPVAHVTSEFRIPADQRLRIRALGPLEVLKGDRPIDNAMWGSARPRELLAFLLMHPSGCSKEQVGVAFWPEATSAQLRNSFHVTLHRLRKALGVPEWITLNKDRYAMDPLAIAEFDVGLFEESISHARKALRRGESDATGLLERSLSHYRGDFLDGEPAGDWHLEFRDRLQRMYVEGLMELGAALSRDERHARASEVYRKVLARDDLHEEAVRALMCSLVRQGERAPALRLYQKFRERLQLELEADPDEETTELFQRIQHGAAVD